MATADQNPKTAAQDQNTKFNSPKPNNAKNSQRTVKANLNSNSIR